LGRATQWCVPAEGDNTALLGFLKWIFITAVIKLDSYTLTRDFYFFSTLAFGDGGDFFCGYTGIILEKNR